MKPTNIRLLKSSYLTLLGTALVLLTSSCSRHSEISSSVVLTPSNTDTQSQPKKVEAENQKPHLVKTQFIASEPNPQSPILWFDGFQNPNWQTRWDIQKRGAWGEENMQAIADPSRKFAKVLRVRYPKNSASPSVSRKNNVPIGGGQFYAKLGIAPKDTLRLSYYVRFSENFDFVKGGKLPGLYGGKGNSGGKIPDGTDGFSTRFMWRRNGDGEVYAYLPTSDKHGTSMGRGKWRFRPGVWYHLEQEVTLNQPSKADGRVRVWLNEQPVLDQKGLTFRTTNELKIEGLFFSTFFGGGNPSWATPKDVHADFANFKVSE